MKSKTSKNTEDIGNKVNTIDTKNDPIWETIRQTTAEQAKQEPILASFLHATVLNHHSLEDALSFHLANTLAKKFEHLQGNGD